MRLPDSHHTVPITMAVVASACALTLMTVTASGVTPRLFLNPAGSVIPSVARVSSKSRSASDLVGSQWKLSKLDACSKHQEWDNTTCFIPVKNGRMENVHCNREGLA